jgi:hypothetical protein
MKKITIILGLVLMSALLFGQKKTKEKVEISHIQLPQYQLVGVKTYTSTWTTNVEQEVLENWNKLGLNANLVKGVLRLSGFDYATEGADINLNLICGELSFGEPEIINIAGEGNPANYRANYRISGEWKIEISGKHQHTIDLTDIINNIEVKYPGLKDSYGAARIIPSSATVEYAISANPEKTQQIVNAQLIKALTDNITEYFNEELGYLKKTSKFKLYGFKSNKKFDMSAWDEPTLKAIELLNKIDAGENPSTIYNEYKTVFTFWDSEFEKNKLNVKENKNVLEPTVKNLINTLLLVNPSEIKEEYIKILDEFIFLDDLEKRVADAKERQAANSYSDMNFSELYKMPVLRNYFYPVTFETSKNGKKRGMIQFSSPYYLNPWETGNFVKIYDLDVYNSVDGKVVSKQAVDLKTIDSYTIFGDKFVQMKFTDPAVVTIGGGASFLEELIKGSASAYKNYSMEVAETNGMVLDLSKGLSGQSEKQLAKSRMNPTIVLAHGKKPIVIYSYSKLAKLLFDKKEISMKIAEGKYGNEPLKIKDANSGKFSGGNNASADTILEIIKDYNSN